MLRIKVHNPNNLPLIDYRELQPLQGTLKDLSDENYQKLLNSLKEKGFFVPFYVWINPADKKKYAIDGHQRLIVLTREKVQPYRLPRLLIEADNIQEAKEKLLVVTSQYGRITEEGMQAFLSDVDVSDFMKQSVSFDALPDFFDNIAPPPPEEDNYQVPELERIQTDIIPGDFFTIGRHKLLCGDARSGDLLGKLMGGAVLDLAVLDPPYNVAYTGGTPEKLQILGDDQEDQEFYKFLHAAFTNLAGHTRPGGAWYVWHADSEGLNFRTAFIEAGIMMKQCIIWVKNSMVMGRQDYQWRHEPCLYGWKPGAAHYFIDDRTNTTVIDDKADYSKLKKSELLDLIKEMTADHSKNTVQYHNKPVRNDVHPTMKPVLLIADQIRNSSKPGDLVADTFGGSGTTMVASDQLHRTCYMMEADPRYCHVIIDRMRRLNPVLDVTRNGQPYTTTLNLQA